MVRRYDSQIMLSGIDANASVFACGADVKSQSSFHIGGRTLLSGENGDLSDPARFREFIESVKEAARGVEGRPRVVAYDQHPAYFSSRAAELFKDAEMVPVQHHHAHIASILAAHTIKEPVIGISFDGTGYGSDGNIWGGEFLIVHPSEFERYGHFKYMKMPGGEMAVREPMRMAFSMLYDHLGEKLLESDYQFMKVKGRHAYVCFKEIMEKNIQTPLTSSCGRLFDALSSVIGITHTVNFEAEAAINLEKFAAASSDEKFYPFEILFKDGSHIADYGEFLDALLSDMEKKADIQDIARRIHNSIAQLILNFSIKMRRASGADKVVMAGGVFQNALLSKTASSLLMKNGFTLLEGHGVPINDLGICIGQTYVASQLA